MTTCKPTFELINGQIAMQVFLLTRNASVLLRFNLRCKLHCLWLHAQHKERSS